MAIDCTRFRTNLARLTPVYDKIFLEDFQPLDGPTLGRHETGTWENDTSDTHISTRIHVGQPDLTESWQRIDAGECASAVCSPPTKFVAFGTESGSYFKEQLDLRSQPFCLTQMRHQTSAGQQAVQIMRALKKIPDMYNEDWLQVHAFDMSNEVKIAGNDFATFVPIRGTNTGGQLVTINLGNDNNFPTSQLTWPQLNYWTTQLSMRGYSKAGSGLPMGMYNLITHSRVWFRLTNGMDSMKDMMALTDPQQASPLFKIGVGVQKPFGNIVPTLNDEFTMRFQRQSPGVLGRVFPYINVATTTGIKRVENPAYLNARYAISFLWHPKAIKMWLPDFGKTHPLMPSINSSMYGKWKFINTEGNLTLLNTDGTTCVVDNSAQRWFFWLVSLERGFQYQYNELIMPILHLIDGSGKDCAIDDPVCGESPQYVEQQFSDDPSQCVAPG